MFIPTSFIILAFLIWLVCQNEKTRTWSSNAILGVIFILYSPFYLGIYISKEVLGWNENGWKASLLTMTLGLFIYYLVIMFIAWLVR